MTHITWRCKCGQVEADLPAKGNRIICYCKSCQAFAQRLGADDHLDAAGGSDLLQLAPQDVRFNKGVEHLRWMRLTEKGPLRWYASCCNTPVANTLATRGLPFASFLAHDIVPQEALPPVRMRVNLKGATAPVEAPKASVLPLILALLGNAAKARITGTWRRNPFFDDNGRPIGPRQDPGGNH